MSKIISHKVLLGKKIRAARQAKGLTQLELSLECNVNQAYISFYERDLRWPSDWVLRKMAETLDVKVQDFAEFVKV